MVSIYYIANAGVYLTDGKSGLLIDGLFEDCVCFDAIPATVRKAILAKEPPFENLSDLLVTHIHRDHYSAAGVAALRQQDAHIRVDFPQNSLNALEQDSVKTLEQKFEDVIWNMNPLYTLVSIPCRHLMDKGEPVAHRAFFLEYAEKTFFFSGDADPVFLYKNFAASSLSVHFQGKVDLAFVNPFFLSLTAGRKFLDFLQPREAIVYHMPLEAEDQMRYHEVLERGMQRYKGTVPIRTPESFMQLLYQDSMASS